MEHPSVHLSKDIIDSIRKNTREAEAAGQLVAGQLQIINEQHWFKLFVPRKYGGLEMALPEAVQLEESIAYADGSVGWVVTLCAGAGLFGGYFHEDLAMEVFAGGTTCIAGSGQANGTADIISDGYIVSGNWPYASGAPHANWFTANCIIRRDGEPVKDIDGNLIVRSFIFKRGEITLHASWKYIGLNATGGYSYSAKDLEVPAHRAFDITAKRVTCDGPVYRYPFLQLAETTIAANISGMSQYFLDLAHEGLLRKDPSYERSKNVRTKGLILISEGRSELHALREDFYGQLQMSWNTHLRNESIPKYLLEKVSQKSLAIASRSREIVNMIYPYVGLEAANPETVINQVWRNINTASQHNLLLSV